MSAKSAAPRAAPGARDTSARESLDHSIRSLLEADLSFAGIPSDYDTHALHPFAARFPPQIPALFIEGLTRAGEVVLDPLSGSGTVLVEAFQRGRIGIGCDLDPLAVLIAGAKSTPLDPERLESSYRRIIESAEKEKPRPVDAVEDREFREYWFRTETAEDLARLAASIDREEEPAVARFLRVVFSSTIVAKSGGVSLARDLAHSRPHRDMNKKVRPVLDEFSRKFAKARDALRTLQGSRGQAIAARADARSLPVRSASVDLIITSPPYASAVDYVRAHKFSLNWLGHDLPGLSRLRRDYIGSEVMALDRGPPPGAPLIESQQELFDGSLAAEAVDRVAQVDRRRSKHIARYFREIRQVLRECHRVLRAGKAAIWVVGRSRIRGVEVETPEVVVDLAHPLGLRLVGMQTRTMDRDRRLLPQARFSKGEGIERRVLTEAVIGFVKD